MDKCTQKSVSIQTVPVLFCCVFFFFHFYKVSSKIKEGKLGNGKKEIVK